MKESNDLLFLFTQGGGVRNLDVSGGAFPGANLSELRGDTIRLCNADLSGANLQRARLMECDFSSANLTEADFSESVLRLCTFDNAHAADVRLEAARIEDSSLWGADFSRARLRGARLTESSWARACLHAADLAEVEGDGVEFRGADLSGASLTRARLIDADFRGADLTGADLSGGDFRGGDFRGAILDDALLKGALFIGATFDREAPAVQTMLSVPSGETARHNASADNAARATPTAGRDKAAAAAITELVMKSLAASTNGNSNLGENFAQVTSKLEAWRAGVGEAGPDDVAGLFESIENSLGAAGTLPPEANVFSSILRSLEDADDLEPPPEWKAWLKQVFPALADEDDGSAMDALASSLMRIVKQTESKNPDNNQPGEAGTGRTNP